MNFKLELTNPEDFNKFIEQGIKAVSLALNYTATEAWGNVRKESPVDHGRLAGSWQLQQDGKDYHIYSNVEYALNVHEGTGIHGPKGQPIEILPKYKKALYWPGASHPVSRVLHPGQKPNKFADRALSKTESRTGEFIDRAIRETLGGLNNA